MLGVLKLGGKAGAANIGQSNLKKVYDGRCFFFVKTGRIMALADTHNELSGIVKPAKPNPILLLDKESKKIGVFQFMGKVPLMRKMIFVALVSLFS